SLPTISHSLKHNAEVKIFIGSAEAIAKVRLIEGESDWIQLELRDPLPLSRGDRFILRYPSPGETIGGGTVINPAPRRRWRRTNHEVIQQLESLMRGTPAELINQALDSSPMSAAQIAESAGLDLQTTLQELPKIAVALNGDLWIRIDALE